MESATQVTELKTPLLEPNETCGDRAQPRNMPEIYEILMQTLLPVSLFLQFGMAFTMHTEGTASLSWTIVNVSVVLFIITAWLYRHTCADANMKTIVLLLLPEILMDMVLALIYFGLEEMAYVALLLGTLLFSGIVIISTFILYMREERPDTEERESEDKPGACQVV